MADVTEQFAVKVTGQLADKPTRAWSVKSPTGQLAD